MMKVTIELFNSSRDTNPDAPPTIVDAIRDADLPPAEKTLNRVFEEVGTITGGGFETIANSLRMILYHIYSNPEILRRLRHELGSAATASINSKDHLSNLEQLPYLTAILTEGLRLSPGIATRSQRVAPDRDIHYKEYTIPRGTPIGMTTLLMHYDSTVYENPHEFDPERWTDTNLRRSADKAYAPFSKGTRICLGM
jgi:cytochrome P450